MLKYSNELIAVADPGCDLRGTRILSTEGGGVDIIESVDGGEVRV